MIGKDFRNLGHSEEALRNFCEKYSREEISSFQQVKVDNI